MKRILCIILSVVVILLPLLALPITVMALPPVYTNAFTAELDDKYERLTSIEGPKTVVVGGSSVAFGIDSALIEKYTGIPTVNFGLYAALGTKLMLDLSRPGIGKGDIVILAPELDAEALSLFFSAENTLRATEEKPSMLLHVRGDNKISLIGGLWKYIQGKLPYVKGDKEIPDFSGVYHSKNFNEYGDIEYDRPYNTMLVNYDPYTPITLSPEILSEEFVEYLNEYIRFCKKRGADVYFAFCPVNELAVADKSDETLDAFVDYLSAVIDCPVIGDIRDNVMEPGYFYDTNLHLNEAGVRVHTVKLLEALFMERGEPVYIEEAGHLPAAPALRAEDVTYDGEPDPNDVYFTYELTEMGYKITGLSELGATMTELTVPYAHDGIRVTIIGDGAFTGCMTLRKLTVPAAFEKNAPDAGYKYISIGNRPFEGSGIRDFYLYSTNLDNVIAAPEAFAGTDASTFTIHLPEGYSIVGTYDWVNRFPASAYRYLYDMERQ